MLQVRVNATSANVCVGFDVLGLALDLANEFTFEPSEKFSFKGFEERYCRKETNLVYQAYIKYFEYINMEPIKVEIGFSGNIPVSRGLGSSSSLIVAGVFAANAIMNNKLSTDELFNICSAIEGHPDNVAPAIYGGLVASFKKDDKYISISYPVSDKLKFMAVIPSVMVSTHEARGVLPKSLEYKDIVNNLSRIVNLPKAFSDGNLELLCDLFNDRLHEPYRGKLIPNYDRIKNICTAEGCAFAISGSGSTMLVIGYDYDIASKLKGFDVEVMPLSLGMGVQIREV
ncbi:MAG: homoserine kinase [Erysipelotrichaceae bacterium]|nr:homoserine kinase [Erysipelotrichaceae bacterium]